MTAHIDKVTVSAFFVVLLLTAASGLLISRWQSRGRRGDLEEWGLGGRQFGALVTWFLVGGDFYTAYTIIAVPSLVFATGAAGFFALPYTIIVYPFVFATMPRLWAVSRVHGLVTPADFVRLRYGSHWLASAVALTGIVSLMPYIALQFTGIETVLTQMGVTGDTAMMKMTPMIIAFAAVAGFTFVAGLRAPALIAFAKTSVLASSSVRVIRKNSVLLPAYTFLLGLVALLGIVGAAAGLHVHSSKEVIPALFTLAFPRWFLGFAFAAITVAALVPAAIMSIAAANIFTRNFYLEYLHQDASSGVQAVVAKYASVGVSACALVFVLVVPMQYSINLQLLGGALVLQTLPAIVFGLWKRLFHHQALLAGWAVSIGVAVTLLLRLKLQSSAYPVAVAGHTFSVYVGIIALLANLAIATTGTIALDSLRVARPVDGTGPADYVT